MTERPEITSGLKNAIERGYSLELAIQSFINAGYNRQDVLDSSKVFGSSIPSVSQPQAQPVIQQPSMPQPSQPQQPSAEPKVIPSPQVPVKFNPLPKQSEEGVNKSTIIILVAILAVLVGLLISTLLFKETILGWFGL